MFDYIHGKYARTQTPCLYKIKIKILSTSLNLFMIICTSQLFTRWIWLVQKMLLSLHLGMHRMSCTALDAAVCTQKWAIQRPSSDTSGTPWSDSQELWFYNFACAALEREALPVCSGKLKTPGFSFWGKLFFQPFIIFQFSSTA